MINNEKNFQENFSLTIAGDSVCVCAVWVPCVPCASAKHNALDEINRYSFLSRKHERPYSPNNSYCERQWRNVAMQSIRGASTSCKCTHKKKRFETRTLVSSDSGVILVHSLALLVSKCQNSVLSWTSVDVHYSVTIGSVCFEFHIVFFASGRIKRILDIMWADYSRKVLHTKTKSGEYIPNSAQHRITWVALTFWHKKNLHMNEPE